MTRLFSSLACLIALFLCYTGCSSSSSSSPPTGNLEFTSLKITAPSTVADNTDFTITIQTLDQNGNEISYTGVVDLTSDAVDAVLTSATGLTLSFNGDSSRTLNDVRFETSISELNANIIATATGTGISASSGNIAVNYAPRMSGLELTAPYVTPTATNFTITVKAVDQSGNDFIGYSGTVTVSDSIGELTSATSLSLVFDGSSASMNITDAQFSSEADDVIITATDGTYTDTSTIDIDNTPRIALLEVTAPSDVDRNTDFTVTVNTLDQFGAAFSFTGNIELSIDADVAVLSSATGLVLSFSGVSSMSITDAQLSSPEPGKDIHITATESLSGIIGQSIVVGVANSVPIARFNNPLEVTVSNADETDLNGTYSVDTSTPVVNGTTMYRHNDNDSYIAYNDTCYMWTIYDDNPNTMYKIRGTYVFPITGLWTACCSGTEGCTPTVTSNPSTAITGSLNTGETLTFVYDYAYEDPDGDASGTPKFQWYRSDFYGEPYEEITGAVSTTYTLTSDDEEKFIFCALIPTDEFGAEGEAIFSAAPSIIAPDAYNVAGTDMPDVNGVYTKAGIYNGAPLYNYGDYYMYVSGCWTGRWRITEGYALGYELPLYKHNEWGNALPDYDIWRDYGACGWTVHADLADNNGDTVINEDDSLGPTVTEVTE